MSTTPHLGLSLTSNEAEVTKFKEWRIAMNGENEDSNMERIDKAFGDLYNNKADLANEFSGFNGGAGASTDDGGGAIGRMATTSTGGAVGDTATSENGFAGGNSAKSTSGGAIGRLANTTSGGAAGDEAKSTDGGGAVGRLAQTTSGGAVGSESKSESGFAGGYHAVVTGGGAIGHNAETSNGGAVGHNSYAQYGGAIGRGAKGGDGLSAGKDAAVKNTGTSDAPKYIDAIQLGTGTNNNPKTLQVYDYQVTEQGSDGTIYLKDVGNLKDSKIANKANIVEVINEIYEDVNNNDASNKADYATSNGFAAGNEASYGDYCVTIGENSESNDHSVAIGNLADANFKDNVAIGTSTRATTDGSISIGRKANSGDFYSYSPTEQEQVTVGSNIAIGDNAQAETKDSIAIGSGASTGKTKWDAETGLYDNADESIAIGKNASAKYHSNGIAIGSGAQADAGIAIGSKSSATDGGGAVGIEAESKNGFAGGYHVKVTGMGAAIGANAHAYHGGAVGSGAQSGNGFAGGYNAKCGTALNGADIDCIQLGTGTNGKEKTLQVYDYQVTAYDTQGEQYLSDVGKLKTLQTSDKTSLVAAINEHDNIIKKCVIDAELESNIAITRELEQDWQYGENGEWSIELSIPQITINDNVFGKIVLPPQTGFTPNGSDSTSCAIYAVYTFEGGFLKSVSPGYKDYHVIAEGANPISYIVMDGNSVKSINIYVGIFQGSMLDVSWFEENIQTVIPLICVSENTISGITGNFTVTSATEPSGANSKLEPLKVRDNRVDILKTTTGVGTQNQSAESAMYITNDKIKINTAEVDASKSKVILSNLQINNSNAFALYENHMDFGNGGARLTWDKDAKDATGSYNLKLDLPSGCFVEFQEDGYVTNINTNTLTTKSTAYEFCDKSDECIVKIESGGSDIFKVNYDTANPAIQVNPNLFKGIKLRAPTNGEHSKIEISDESVTLFGNVILDSVETAGISDPKDIEYLKTKNLPSIIIDLKKEIESLKAEITALKSQ